MSGALGYIIKCIAVCQPLFSIFLIVFLLVFVLFLRAPIIKDDYQVGKWYKVLLDGVKDNKGNDYYFLIKKGRENKVIINFYGGGLSINNET